MQVTRVEKWLSNENNQEVHFFASPNRSDYVLGYNPSVFSRESIIELCKTNGIEVPDFS